MRKDNTSQGLPSLLIQAFPWHFLAERTLKRLSVHPSLSCFLGLTDARLILSESCKVRKNTATETHFPRALHIPMWHLVAYSACFTHFYSKKTCTLRGSFSLRILEQSKTHMFCGSRYERLLDPASWSACGWAVSSWFWCSLCPHYAPGIRGHNLASTWSFQCRLLRFQLYYLLAVWSWAMFEPQCASLPRLQQEDNMHFCFVGWRLELDGIAHIKYLTGHLIHTSIQNMVVDIIIPPNICSPTHSKFKKKKSVLVVKHKGQYPYYINKTIMVFPFLWVLKQNHGYKIQSRAKLNFQESDI